MRIAVLTSSYPTTPEDPSGHFVRTEVQALIEAGHEVTLLLPESEVRRSEPTAALRELPHWGLFGWPGALERLRRSPWRIAGLAPFAFAARRAIRREGPFQRLVIHWIFPGFWPICRDFGGESIDVTAHGSDVSLLERFPSSLQRDVMRALARERVTLRCVSQDLAERIKRLAATHRLDLRSIEIAPARIAVPHLPSRRELRRQLGLPTTPVAIIVGRAVQGKCIDRAILAIDASTAEHAHLASTLIIVIGDGPELRRLSRRFPKVRWLGRQARIDTLRQIRAADLLVSASALEGAPTAIREALLLGTPVVAAKAGDLETIARLEPLLSVVSPFDAEPTGATCRLIAQRLDAACSRG